MGGSSSNSKKILVIGSIGMDISIFSEDIPKSGETKKGKTLINPGGKGNNQAISCARAGGETIFMGVVGDDYYKKLKQTLEENNVSPELKKMNNTETHTASIIIGTNGKSKIVVNPGADNYLDINLINKNINLINDSYIVIFQLEIPFETNKYAIEKCYERRKIIILRPSPAIELPENIIQKATYLILNESELSIISGMPTNDEKQIDLACQRIMEKGAQNLIVPLINKGCILWNKEGKKEYCSYIKDNVIDSTGSMDCFIGVFAAYLSKNSSLDDAIKYANLASDISTKSLGTINSFPKLEEINREKDKIKNW